MSEFKSFQVSVQLSIGFSEEAQKKKVSIVSQYIDGHSLTVGASEAAESAMKSLLKSLEKEGVEVE